MNNSLSLNRRDFIKTLSSAGAGFVLAFYLPSKELLFANSTHQALEFAPNAWLKIDTSGLVTIIVAKSEMGQGVRTSIPMIVAEELEADWSRVRYEQADLQPQYGDMSTSGSRSIRTGMETLRKAGATAREMLITAAAQTWNVHRNACKAERGFIIHNPTGRKLGYGELVEAAVKVPVPENPSLKDPKEFHIIGTAIKRIDTSDKTDGTAVFGIDVKVPGMLYASVVRCPVFGGRVASFDATKAKAIKGVRDIIQIEQTVAIIAENTWLALKGREKTEIVWNEGPNTNLSNSSIREMFIEKSKAMGAVVEKLGNPSSAFSTATKTTEAIYEAPFAAHATMEPMNATASYKNGKCEIWAPTQNPEWIQRDAAQALGIAQKDVIVHITLLGGGFGRRSLPDYALDAAKISKAISVPVKVTWTREDDMQHDWYRPASYHVLAGAFDANRNLIGWTHRLVAPSILGQRSPDQIKDGLDRRACECAVEMPYSIPHVLIDYQMANTPVPIGAWRSVYASQNVFVVESFIDELAFAANTDPVQFRLELLKRSPRMSQVVRLAAEKAGWGKPLPKGHALGIACAKSFETYVAEVAEVSLDEEKRARVHRVVAAVDCGIAVNPNTIEAQIEGSIVYGLSATLKDEITIEHGRVQQSNFNDYQMPRIDEMPKVEVHLVKSSEPPGGIGEPGLPPVAPAVCNAIFSLINTRVRKLPLRIA